VFKEIIRQKLHENAKAKIKLKDLTSQMHNRAHEIYHGIAPDLPRFGNHHNDTAIDVISGMIYDEFNKHQNNFKLNLPYKKITKKAIGGYLDKNEPMISRQNEKKKYQKATKPNNKEIKITEPKPAQTYSQKAGYETATFTTKPIRRSFK